jgi:hypothetical protein
VQKKQKKQNKDSCYVVEVRYIELEEQQINTQDQEERWDKEKKKKRQDEAIYLNSPLAGP